jgi:hypothetical protein
VEDDTDVTEEAPEFLRKYGALIAAAAAVILILGGFAAARLADRPAPGLDTPDGTVRTLVRSMRASDPDTRTYEPFFEDKAVAGAVAQSVRQGVFPKDLDIGEISAETGSENATVTVKWTIQRPSVAENGSVFLLKLSEGRWRIVDAQSKQVGPGAESPKSPKAKEGTAAP